MSSISDIVVYILATIGGRSCMSRPDTGTCRLYPENGAEFCRGNDYRSLWEMFQVASNNLRAIFGEGGTVTYDLLRRDAAISASISSMDMAGRPLASAFLLIPSISVNMDARSSKSLFWNCGFDVMLNGKRCSLTTVLAKMTNAVDMVMPTVSQNDPKSRFRSLSILMLTPVCVIFSSYCNRKHRHCITIAG